MVVGDTRLEDGSLDLGPDADDVLSAAMLKTLVNGGTADALHTHAAQPAAGGGGVCYTAWGLDTCAEGFGIAYRGEAIGVHDVVYYNVNTRGFESSTGSATVLCAAQALVDGMERQGNVTGRWVRGIHATSSPTNLMDRNTYMFSRRLPCAKCCK